MYKISDTNKLTELVKWCALTLHTKQTNKFQSFECFHLHIASIFISSPLVCHSFVSFLSFVLIISQFIIYFPYTKSLSLWFYSLSFRLLLVWFFPDFLLCTIEFETWPKWDERNRYFEEKKIQWKENTKLNLISDLTCTKAAVIPQSKHSEIQIEKYSNEGRNIGFGNVNLRHRNGNGQHTWTNANCIGRCGYGGTDDGQVNVLDDQSNGDQNGFIDGNNADHKYIS